MRFTARVFGCPRLDRLVWLLALVLLVAGGGAARADLIFLLGADGCSSGCGSAPFGTVDVSQVNPQEI